MAPQGGSYVGVPTSPAGPWPSVCPITAVSKGVKPTLSRGIPKASSFASYVRSRSLWACGDRAGRYGPVETRQVVMGLWRQGRSLWACGDRAGRYGPVETGQVVMGLWRQGSVRELRVPTLRTTRAECSSMEGQREHHSAEG